LIDLECVCDSWNIVKKGKVAKIDAESWFNSFELKIKSEFVVNLKIRNKFLRIEN
jgi:hypothetical protein